MKRSAVNLVCLAFVSAIATPALAVHTSVAEIKNEPSSVPHFEVGSNGSAYTKVQKPEHGFRVKNLRVYISMEFNEGRVMAWSVTPYMTVGGTGGQRHMLLKPIFKDYVLDGKVNPTKVDTVLTTDAIRTGKYNDQMVKACNNMAQQLRNKGQTNKAIFAQDRKINLYFGARLKITPTLAFVGDREVYSKAPVKRTLTCKKWPGAAVQTAGAIQAKMKIVKAEFAIDPRFDRMTAVCPVNVPLIAKIITDGKGVVSYRLRSASGKYSPTYQAVVTSKRDGVYQTSHIVQIKVPLAKKGTTGGTAGINTLQSNPTPGNVHKNSFRAETVAPNAVVSAYDGYNITCRGKITPSVATSKQDLRTNQPKPPTRPGGFVAKPKPKKPGLSAKTAATGGGGGSGGGKGKADLVATKKGMGIGNKTYGWGSTATLSKNQVSKRGLGSNKNLCQLKRVRFQPYNQGNGAAGPFTAKLSVKAGNKSLSNKNKNVAGLPPKSGLPTGNGWLAYTVLVRQGQNKLRAQLDPGKKVAESNEGNNGKNLTVKVPFSCKKG